MSEFSWPSHPYIDAIVEAQEMLAFYESDIQDGEGEGLEGFLWRAYVASREAIRLFPSYLAVIGLERPEWIGLSRSVPEEIQGRVLDHLDKVAAKALERKKDPAAALQLRESIIGSLIFEVAFLSKWQRDRETAAPWRAPKFKRLRPTLNTIFTRVAAETGASRKYVLKVYESEYPAEWRAEAEELVARIAAMSAYPDKAPAVERKKPTKKRRPSPGHGWRKSLKKLE